MLLIQLIASGIARGSLYALMALSMTIIYRATTVLNFGQGDLLMGAAFAIYAMVVLLHLPFVAAATLGIALLFAVGAGIQTFLVHPIRSAPHLSVAMMAMASGFLLRGIARFFFGGDVLPFPAVYPEKTYLWGPLVITSSDLITTAAVLGLLLLLWAAFALTPLGLSARATFQSPRGSAMVGINVGRFQRNIWGLGAAMAAVSGILIAPITLLYPDMAAAALVHGFAAITLGGFGSFAGAVVGGFILGLAELLVGVYLDTSLIDLTPYLVIIVLLLVRPAGLFGQRATVRV
jgi:branched-chain amino acid transport system permease protein